MIGDANADRFPIRIFDWLLSTFEEGHVSFYRSSELAAILERAGFRVARTETMDLRNYALLTARPGGGLVLPSEGSNRHQATNRSLRHAL